ncbi:hypothetical protein VaNZ11_015279, partial [Volvox africanus]
PFSTDVTAGSPAALNAAAATAAGGFGSGGGTSGAAVLGWVQYGGAVLSGLASYVTDGAVSTIQGLAAVATGQPWGSAAAAGIPGVASPRYCWLLAAVLTSAPALRSLYVHNHALPEAAAEGVGQLAAALAGNTRLTALSLRGSSVGDAGAAALARALSGHNSTLQLLNLRRCQLHDEGVSALCSCLVENRGLRALDLSHNRVQGQGPGAGQAGGRLAGLERALRLNTSLQELRLEGWRDTFDNPLAASSLAAALTINEGLRTLSLAGCCLNSQSAAALASALATNTCLTSLDLSAACADGAPGFGGGGGGIGGGGSSNALAASATAADAGSGPEGRIGDAGVAALGAALSRNRSLRELYLSGCRCGELGGAALLDALRTNSILQVLDLSGNGAGGDVSGFAFSGDVIGGGLEDAAGGSGSGSGGGSGLRSPTVAAAAITGLDDGSATCVFTALQSNSGIRVLRMRGANRLTLRAMRAAGEMLRRNESLRELDLSNSTFLAADPATAPPPPPPALLLQSHNSQPHPHSTSAAATATSAAATGLTSRPASALGAQLAERAAEAMPSPLQSSLSLPSLPSSRSLPPLGHDQALARHREQEHHHHHHQNECGNDPHPPGQDSAAGGTAMTAAPPRRNGSFASVLSRVPSVGGLTGHGGGSGGGGGGEEGLSAEAWEVVGAMWSALAGGLAVNGRLRVLRVSYCGLGTVGVAALAPALTQNTSLQELDLAGVPESTARTQLAAVIVKAAAAMAAAAAADASVTSPPASHFHVAAHVASGGGGGGEGGGCALNCIRATDEAYEVVDLLGASKVTSRAAEEAAAAAEEAMRAPGRRGGKGGSGGGGAVSLLLSDGAGGGGKAGSGSGGGIGREGAWGWRLWRR